MHFVSNDEARTRLVQMGERPEAIFTIGSPDIDVMLSKDLPNLREVRSRYEIPSWKRYGIAMYHPVTTELAKVRNHARQVVQALRDSGMSFVVVYPNNDSGSEEIIEELRTLERVPRFRLLTSMRFQHFLTLMKNAAVVLGNSSAGIREAPVYGVPSINVGTRQNNRFQHESIVNVPDNAKAIVSALKALPRRFPPTHHFGSGRSAELFIKALRGSALWKISGQKGFQDVRFGADR
jgi:UDP-N-acetylglucosamine 2-epimerase (hydrolysing)